MLRTQGPGEHPKIDHKVKVSFESYVPQENSRYSYLSSLVSKK